ncbi:ABC transporter ATP-binding protein [Schaalia vaccimaxillae]|uniref:ABC transporter ATP-binding protein n=1 Tax=Schaalia vaccimaxillae TaxID=183916 RepID=UPI0003B67F1B|nr:ABC transporter ATP-binding protein [Schaalia vaccimaxillae]
MTSESLSRHRDTSSGEPYSSPLIDIAALSKNYKGQPALQDFNLTLSAGHIVGLLGANGSGKTTLLKILAGVLADWTGNVRIAGHKPAPATKAIVSYLPDADFLNPDLTPSAAIAYYQRFFADFDAQKAAKLVEYFALPANRTLKEMSRGMGQKLQIALVMSRNAKVYLLDEPLSGVDPAARDVILQGILTDFNPESLMLMSTHLIADVEAIIDTAVFVKEGKVLLHADADDLRSESGLSLDAFFRQEYR